MRSFSGLVSIVAISAFAIAMAFSCSESGESAPSIPHQITSSDDSYCLGCHKTGANGAPVTPHPDRAGCTNCHKP